MKTQLKNALNLMALLLLATTTLSSCDSDRECPAPEVRTFDISGFTQVDAGENFRITLRQGNSFSVRAEGCSDDLDDLVMEVEGDELDIRYRKWYKNRNLVEIEIEMPELTGFSFSGAAKATVLPFDETPFIEVGLSGAAKATFSGQMEQASIDMSGASEFELGGSAGKLFAELSGSSRLRAYDCQVQTADVEASGGSKAWLAVEESLSADVSGGSRVYYKGNPANIDINESGGGKVVRE